MEFVTGFYVAPRMKNGKLIVAEKKISPKSRVISPQNSRFGQPEGGFTAGKVT